MVKRVLCFSSFRAMRGKDINRLLVNVVAIAIVLFGILTVAVPVRAQTPQPAAKEAIVQEIKGYAKRDVDNDTPKRTEFIVNLYQNEKVGPTSREIAEIYEEEYDRLKKAKRSNFWERLVPSDGWGVALVLGVLLIFRDVLIEGISNLMKAIGSVLYQNFAGTPLFHNFSLKRYREALQEKHKQLHITFRPERPLLMEKAYVPLKVVGASDTNPIDIYEALEKHGKLVVTGPPGSGKSMLLKDIVLRYANELLKLPEQPIAILLEMHRLSNPQKSLKQHLVEALARDDFPNAELFVSQGLKRGKLMLLFDGLDDVSSSERPRVVQEINNLLDYLEEHRCRFIITCRTAIYNSQFGHHVPIKEIVQFNARQIRLFLKPWEVDMPEEKSIEQLMNMLLDRPQIMTLARNPLLLSIIAYLYTDTSFVLPHSRVEFYQKATDILLNLSHQEGGNKYLARDKRSVLQHLAIYFQENANRQQQDRRKVDYRQVLLEIRKVVPDINLSSQDVPALLNEIVDPSGLLVEIDNANSSQYQFAHLTLQEFFAAAALREDAEGLVKYFLEDKDTWRETAKLWCSLAENSTTAIESIYAEDPITAFECLADAQVVNQERATKIIDDFKKRLSDAKKDNQIIQAFAAVAANNRRGEAVFEFLEETLVADEDSVRRAAAAEALARTNLPSAAQVLANHYNKRSEVRDHLVNMGDLAVPELLELSKRGSETAIDDLLKIKSSYAIKALVSLSRSADENVAKRAIWCLTALLPVSEVKEVLRNNQILEE